MRKILVICTITLFGLNLFSKERLPETINAYQPVIFPVISPNSDELYFTRKWHPENTGGIYDDDDVWVSKRNKSSDWKEPIRLGTGINRKNSNSLFYIFPDGKKALVFGSYLKTQENDESQNCFAIAKRINKLWEQPEPIIIEEFYSKSKNYSATMSTDGRVLLASLQREDSYGDLDIYISFYDPQTKIYSKPKNLGEKINTKGVDLVSYLALDNKTLYFATNGRKGKGKLDFFVTRRLDDTWMNWSDPQPLDFINSEWDENSLSLNLTGDTLYFTSGDTLAGREGIYFDTIPPDYKPLPYLILQGNIIAVDGNKPELLKQPVYIKIDNFDIDYYFYDTVYDGTFRFIVPYKTQYNFFISAKGFWDYSFSTNSSKFLEPTIQNYDIVLKRKENTKRLIGMLYFPTDIDTLDIQSIDSLKKMCEKIKTEKFSKILVVGHTDETGTEEYNQQLSLSRAKNTAKLISSYLKLSNDSIIFEGKGKTEPISKELAKNRRVEIYLLNDE